MADTTISVSFTELEALHEVLEAARCYWHQREASERAAAALRVTNKLYWTIGEYLPKTGEPSARFRAVPWRSSGDTIGRLLGFVDNLRREYDNKNDPWWADTIIAANSFAALLTPEEWRTFSKSLRRLGLSLEIDPDLPANRMAAERRDIGPWAAESE